MPKQPLDKEPVKKSRMVASWHLIRMAPWWLIAAIVFGLCFIYTGAVSEATSCCNTSRRQITPCVQVGGLVAATRWGDTLQRQIASCVLENFCEISVSATEFGRCNKSQKIKSYWICATCCGDKFFGSDKDFRKNSTVHTKRFVAATCRLVCTDLKVSTIHKRMLRTLIVL